MSQIIEIDLDALRDEIAEYSHAAQNTDSDDAFLFYLDELCKNNRLLAALEEKELIK